MNRIEQVVAIKQLNLEGLQGPKEFLTEVLILSTLRHPNLVNLVGYCTEGDQRLLVYEFMSKGSLEDHLFRKHTYCIAWSIHLYIVVRVIVVLLILVILSTHLKIA